MSRRTSGAIPPPPTPAQVRAAVGRTVPDVIAPGLRILFSGINPGLYSAAVGHHFARPGNRFWPVLYTAGLTPHRLAPHQERELLSLGYGITNLVARSTATAAALDPRELVRGARTLEAKVRRYRPRVLAILGLTAYRTAFRRPRATLGRQPEIIGDTVIWLLPNPSGLNAHFTPTTLTPLFHALLEAVPQP